MDGHPPPTSEPTDEEYAAFIGPNVHKYLPKFRAYAENPVGFHAGWHWPAFLFTFWWFLYRKMYLWAVVCFVTLLVPYLQIFIMIGWGVAANYLYFKHANAKMQELRSYHGSHYAAYLPQTGGVNGWVPWVAVIVSGGFLLLMVAGAVGVALLAS